VEARRFRSRREPHRPAGPPRAMPPPGLGRSHFPMGAAGGAHTPAVGRACPCSSSFASASVRRRLPDLPPSLRGSPRR
jgi:hypothetical protein